MERRLYATTEVGVSLCAANAQRVAEEGKSVVCASRSIPDVQFVKLTAGNGITNQLDPTVARERELVFSVHCGVTGHRHHCGPRTVRTVSGVVGDLEPVVCEDRRQVCAGAECRSVITNGDENLSRPGTNINCYPVSVGGSPCAGCHGCVAVTSVVHFADGTAAVNGLAARDMRHVSQSQWEDGPLVGFGRVRKPCRARDDGRRQGGETWGRNDRCKHLLTRTNERGGKRCGTNRVEVCCIARNNVTGLSVGLVWPNGGQRGKIWRTTARATAKSTASAKRAAPESSHGSPALAFYGLDCAGHNTCVSGGA